MSDELPPHRGLRAFQEHIEAVYGERDAARGLPSTFMWFTEEVGELARAIRVENGAVVVIEAIAAAEQRFEVRRDGG